MSRAKAAMVAVQKLGRSACLLGLLALSGGPLYAEEPLSAIDWLSGSVRRPAGVPTAQTPPEAWRPASSQGTSVAAPTQRNDIATSGTVGPVSTFRLDEINPDKLGLISADKAGLPRDLWRDTTASVLADQLQDLPIGALPALDALIRRALIAQLSPPASSDGTLFLARVDKLLEMGALAPAAALLDAAGPGDAQRFRRRFDIALLQGHEHQACATLANSPGIAPSTPVRIFCLARDGDWRAAALTFTTSEALGLIEPQLANLMAQFLDPELADNAPAPTISGPLTPLAFRLFEAIGQPVHTAGLPLAFTWTELSPQSGWRARIDAGERLAHAGVLPADTLFTLYRERRAAASGGLWDRVASVAALDRALAAKDSAAIARATEGSYDNLAPAGLLVPLAQAYGATLRGLRDELPPPAQSRALHLGLIGPEPEAWANWPATDKRDRFLIALAAQSPNLPPAPDEQCRILAGVFTPPPPPAPTGAPGPLLLSALSDLAAATEGDLRRLETGLAALRAMGLSDDARRIALQIAILGAPE